MCSSDLIFQARIACHMHVTNTPCPYNSNLHLTHKNYLHSAALSGLKFSNKIPLFSYRLSSLLKSVAGFSQLCSLLVTVNFLSPYPVMLILVESFCRGNYGDSNTIVYLYRYSSIRSSILSFTILPSNSFALILLLTQ